MMNNRTFSDNLIATSKSGLFELNYIRRFLVTNFQKLSLSQLHRWLILSPGLSLNPEVQSEFLTSLALPLDLHSDASGEVCRSLPQTHR